ncbi:hypothetical protein GQ457_04G018090 [Hibiscus cannabinus]
MEDLNASLKCSTSHQEDSIGKVSEEEEIAKLFKKFSRIMKEKKEQSKHESRKMRHDPIICFECKRSGHVKYDCPRTKKRESKKKAFMATWSDEESSTKNYEANLCLMAIQKDEFKKKEFDLQKLQNEKQR